MNIKSGSKALVVYKGKVLLVLRDDIPTIPHPNTWDLPGGGIEKDETDEVALVRELQEEINISPSNVHFLEKLIFSKDYYLALYVVYLTENEFDKLELGEEGQKMEFFSFEEIFKLNISPIMRENLMKYGKEVTHLLNSSG